MNALKRSPLFALLSCFIFAMTLPAMAQYTTGVKGGDWIKYNFDFSYMGVSYKGTIKLTIQEVTSTYITGTVEYTGNFPSPPSPSFTIYIPTWDGGNFFLIPTNLAVGQTIPGSYMTVQAIVDWQGRKAIKAYDPSGLGEAYWDQATGVLLEIKFTAGATGSIKAVETNMFSFGIDWMFWVVIIVVVVVVAVVAVTIMRGIRKPPTAPPPTAQPPPPPPPPAPES